MRLLAWLIAYSVSLVAVRILGLVLHFTARDRAAVTGRFSWIGQSANLHMGFVIGETGVGLILTGVVCKFYMYHVWLAKNNLTTFQHIMQSRPPKQTPHHKVAPQGFPEKIQQTVAGIKSSSEPSEGNEDVNEQSKDHNALTHKPSHLGDGAKFKKEQQASEQKPVTKLQSDFNVFNKSLLVKQKHSALHKKQDSPDI